MSATLVKPTYAGGRPAPTEYHCPFCGRFLLASTAPSGDARVKCNRCKSWAQLTLEWPKVSRN